MFQQYVAFFKRYDFSFLLMIVVIFCIGILNLYSATHAVSGGPLADLYQTQIIFFVVAFFIALGLGFVRPATIQRYSYLIYFLNIILLILVLVVGMRAMGGKRWIGFGPFRIQPSEFMKIAIVLALSRWYSKHDPEQDVGLKEMIIPFIMTAVPSVLIIIQPDLGTGLLLFFIFGMITFYRRLKWKMIMIMLVVGVISGGIMYKFGLKEYQRQRIITFLNPWDDARGSGYNAIQSEIAIGSGQLFGKGFKRSSQASLKYLPENHTDFIFSIYNEEHGFFGSVVLITLYLLLLLRFIWLSTSVLNFYDSVLSIGVMSIFFWQVFINMGMVTGLLPIVGVPLPLMSYGGSSLLTFGIACGLATSMSNSRNLF